MSKETEKEVDISDFFTTDNEINGIWYEPCPYGKHTNIEFKLLGISSDVTVTAGDQYDKDMEAAKKETDPVKRDRLETEALVRRVASMVVDIRGKNGFVPKINGEPLTYTKENVKKILRGSRAIRNEFLKVIGGGEDFMTRKG